MFIEGLFTVTGALVWLCGFLAAVLFAVVGAIEISRRARSKFGRRRVMRRWRHDVYRITDVRDIFKEKV